MLFLSVRGFSDYAGPKRPLAICAAAVLPSSYSEWSRHPDLRAFRSSIAPPTDASVYASRDTSRCPQQDSRSGWIRYFLSCRALASPTTCRFIPALSCLPVTREQSRTIGKSWQIISAKRTYQLSKSFLVGHPRSGPARQNRAKLSPQCSLEKTTSKVRIRDCHGAAVVPRGFQLFSKRY